MKMNKAGRKLISFNLCVDGVIENKDFIKEFDRLYGSNLSMIGAPIELMIDKSTGRIDSDVKELLEFIYKYVYLPINNGGLISRKPITTSE